MKKLALHILYILPLVALLLMGCGPSGSSFRIKGSFRDMKAGELYIYNLSEERARFDTLTIKEGEFLYKGEVSEVTPFILVFPNGMEQVIFAGQGEDLKYEATANDLKNYVVNGSKENKLMNQFRKETYTQNPSMIVGTAREYIKENIESPVALYLFDHYFVKNDEVSTAETESLLKLLKAKHKDNHYLMDVESSISLATRHEIGKKLKDIALTKRDKTTKKLWATQKDLNLIAFWSTWLTNGYDISWKIRQINDEYTQDGKLRIAAISLDIERYRWEENTRIDSLSTIEHYCDGLGFESPVAKEFGINSLPFFILTDRDHKILSTSTTIEQLKTELAKHK